MTKKGDAQRAELQAKIWTIANGVRHSVDGRDFKQFVLGALFYRYISEHFTDYMKNGDESVDYASLSDKIITTEIKEDAMKNERVFRLSQSAFYKCT